MKLAMLPAATAVGKLQHHTLDLHWYPGTATWYGDPEGDGSTGNKISLLFVILLQTSVALTLLIKIVFGIRHN